MQGSKQWVALALLVAGWGCRGDNPTRAAKATAAAPGPASAVSTANGARSLNARPLEVSFFIDGAPQAPLRIPSDRLPVRLRELVATSGLATLHATAASGRALRIDLAKFADSPVLVTRDGSGLRLTLHRGPAEDPGAPVMAVSGWTSLEGRTAGYQPSSEGEARPLSIVRFGRATDVTAADFDQLPAAAWRDGPREAASARRLGHVLALAGPVAEATALEIRDGHGNTFTLRGDELAELDAIVLKRTDAGAFNLKGPPRLDREAKHRAKQPKTREWRVRDVRSFRLMK